MRAIGNDNIDWDKHWEEHKSDPNFTDPKAFDYFIDLLPKNFRVLELGCGIGKWAEAFLRAGASEYVGVDFSAIAIEEARRRYAGKPCKFLLMRAEEMDFDNEFDLVFTHTFLQHTTIITKRRLLPKIWKALRPSGLLVIQEKCDVFTPTTFTRDGWVRFITAFGFEFLRMTPEGDPRNGFVFRKESEWKVIK